MTAVDEIKSRMDIVDLVTQSGVKLRRSGKSYSGFCPFHSNTRTPSFVVFPESGTWRCFGQCNEGGDVFSYVMKKEGWDFTQTIHHLAERTGVVLEEQSPQTQQEDEHLERLRGLLDEAAIFYHHHLVKNPAGNHALGFLQRRGLTGETIETFNLGYALDSWDSAASHFRQKGYSEPEMIEAGLVSERQNAPGIYDRFRNRIIFPIQDGMGKMAGFGARILNPDDQPKFINSPQTPLFDKGRLFYGLYQARKVIRAQDQVVIVEGYLDVILLHQAGFNNAVSPMGTALSEDQFRMLKRFTRRMVLALDADAAGEKATLRGLEIARGAMDHSPEIMPGPGGIFNPRGLLRQEARLDADLRVTTLPPGMDPDEVVLKDPEEWKKIISGAKPIVLHVMDLLLSTSDLNDPKIKSGIAAQILPLIEDVPNPIEREDYRQRLARALHLDELALMAKQPARSGSSRRTSRGKEVTQIPEKVPERQGNPIRNIEAHILRLLLRQPDAVYRLDRALQQVRLTRFSVQDFEQVDHQLLIRLIIQSLEQEQMDPKQFINNNLSEDLKGIVETYKKPFEGKEPESKDLILDLVRTVLRMRQIRTREGISQLQFLQQELQEQGIFSLDAYQEMAVQYSQTLLSLNQALNLSLQLD